LNFKGFSKNTFLEIKKLSEVKHYSNLKKNQTRKC